MPRRPLTAITHSTADGVALLRAAMVHSVKYTYRLRSGAAQKAICLPGTGCGPLYCPNCACKAAQEIQASPQARQGPCVYSIASS